MNEWSKPEIEENIKSYGDTWLYLYTPLCGTCQVAGKMISIVAELVPQVRWGKCDLNYIPEYAADWEIESVPCLLLFRNGQVKKKIYAFQSVPFLYETVKNST